MSEKNIVWQQSTINRNDRERLNGHRAAVIWFTGLSGAGKSTLAHALEAALHRQGHRTLVLDGDNVRHGLCSDLGFSPADRHENLRRIAEVAKITHDAGIITLAAFISPMRADRAMIKRIIGPEHFIEIHVKCPVNICENRDVKGMYKKARSGEIKEFTGVSAPYEVPEAADLALDTDATSIDDCVYSILQRLQSTVNLK
jgi:adenylylsulfate kinase